MKKRRSHYSFLAQTQNKQIPSIQIFNIIHLKFLLKQ